ncbi:MAG: DUF669 domain-containing protein [Nitrososphaerota archaeon]
MPKFDLGFNVDDFMAELEPVPPGIYNVRITSADIGTSRSGNPKLTLKYTILDDFADDGNGNTVKVGGRVIFEDIPLLEQTAWRIGRLYKALGYDSIGSEIDTDELLNMELQLEVGLDRVIRNGQETDDLRNVVVGHVPRT